MGYERSVGSPEAAVPLGQDQRVSGAENARMLIYCTECCDRARRAGIPVKATEHTLSVPPKEYLIQSTVGRSGRTDYWKVKCTQCGYERIGDLSHD